MKKTMLFAGIAGLLMPAFLSAGCASTTSQCLPGALEISHGSAAPGSAVTISSEPTACDLQIANGTTYTFTLVAEAHGDGPVDLGSTPVNSDGSFSSAVLIPEDFPSGNATLLVTGSAFDDCVLGDSCAAYSAALRIR